MSFRFFSGKDYFSALNLSTSAGDDEIKKSFRQGLKNSKRHKTQIFFLKSSNSPCLAFLASVSPRSQFGARQRHLHQNQQSVRNFEQCEAAPNLPNSLGERRVGRVSRQCSSGERCWPHAIRFALRRRAFAPLRRVPILQENWKAESKTGKDDYSCRPVYCGAAVYLWQEI